jgi:predicted oxidoreductase
MNWGTWGANHSSEKMSQLILSAFNNGINSFDHADIYGGYTTEETFGEAFLKTGINRKNVFYISKCGIMYPSEKLPIKVKHYDYSEKHLIQSVDNSLKYLKTDYLDCLLLHRPSPLMDISEISNTITRLMKENKIRSFGVSNFTVSQMEMFKGKLKISFNQINLSLTNLDSIFDGTLEYMQTNDIIPMAYSPLGQYYKTENTKLKEVVDIFTKKYNCSDDQLLLSWLIKLPSGVYPVIGTTKVNRINKSLGSLKIDIEISDWFEILEASVGKRVA